MQANRFLVLFLTFMCYTAYHASRRPLSIVKSVLHGEPSGGANSAHLEVTWTASNIGGRQGWGGGPLVGVEVCVLRAAAALLAIAAKQHGGRSTSQAAGRRSGSVWGP